MRFGILYLAGDLKNFFGEIYLRKNYIYRQILPEEIEILLPKLKQVCLKVGLIFFKLI